MQQEKLRFPYTWEERRPAIHEGVLFIPDHYDKHTQWTFPSWEEIFGNSNPVVIEYCTGNGTWLTKKAEDKSTNWVGVEWRFDRVQQIWAKKQRQGLDNLFIVSGDAQIFIRDYLHDLSVDSIYVNFPDPWPKEKHAKHRLFRPPFIEQMNRTAKGGAHLTVVTDDPRYSNQIITATLANPAWVSTFPDPYYVTEWKDYGTSFFDSLWREKGLTIRYLQFKKVL